MIQKENILFSFCRFSKTFPSHCKNWQLVTHALFLVVGPGIPTSRQVLPVTGFIAAELSHVSLYFIGMYDSSGQGLHSPPPPFKLPGHNWQLCQQTNKAIKPQTLRKDNFNCEIEGD